MPIQSYSTQSGRVNKLKGEILAHAIPSEVLGITGQQKKIGKNNGDNVVFRRWLPKGAATTNATTLNALTGITTANHLTTEGVTPSADTLTPQDITVTLNQYHVLYAVTDKSVDLYEDNIPEEMKQQTGERLGLVRELVRYGALKACTNLFYAGGTARDEVDEAVSLQLLRRVARSIKGNHGKFIRRTLDASPNFSTSPVEASFLVFADTDCEADIRDLPGFKHVSEYGQRKPVHENEIGSCESFRFILSADLIPIPDIGAAIGATGLYSTTGTLLDVYPMIVVADNAWGQVALRGQDSLDVVYLAPGEKDKNDPLGQRGYIGAKCYHAASVLNDGWMAVVEVGIDDLT